MKTLYRYTPHTNSHRYELITHSQLWFTNPESFNDPLDSKLAYRQDYSEEEIEFFWNYFLQSRPECPLSLKELLELWGTNKKFIEQQNRIFDVFRSNMGVICFSESTNNLLMWSHYANSHKGIVYEFTPDLFSDSTTESFKAQPLKVNYKRDNKYELLSYALTGKQKQEQFVTEQLTKANDWAYEKEYRFIDVNGYGNKLFRKKSLKSVIIGAKTPKEEIIRLQSLCKKNGFEHVTFKQANISPGEFKITLVNIS